MNKLKNGTHNDSFMEDDLTLQSYEARVVPGFGAKHDVCSTSLGVMQKYYVINTLRNV